MIEEEEAQAFRGVSVNQYQNERPWANSAWAKSAFWVRMTGLDSSYQPYVGDGGAGAKTQLV